MLNTNRTLNDIIQHALTLHHDEREKFLDQELSTDITLRKRISDFIIEVEQRQSTKTKQDDTTVLPTAKPSQANPNTATRKSWASYFYSDWKQLLVIGLLIGMTSLCGYFCFEYFQTKNKLSQTSEEQRQLLYSQIEKLRNSYQRANKSVYHHIANQNANLFVKFVYGYIPANAEQLDHLRVIARGFNSAHVEELVLAGDSTPQTLCYLAAWHWGMGEGFRRIKE